MIKRILYIGSLFLATSFPLSAQQYQENALRFSDIHVNGTARFQGLGGGHAALGGDPSAMTSNPAGLGFYTRSEITVTPGYQSLSSDSRYLSSMVRESKDGAFLGNVSLVIANEVHGFRPTKWRGTAMGISYNRQTTFNRSYGFGGSGTTQYAFVDQLVDNLNDAIQRGDFHRSQLDQGYDVDSRTGEVYLDYLEGVYYNIYAIDPENDDENALFYPVETSSPVAPSGYVDYTGNHSQWTFTYAGNYDNKLYIGGSLGINRIVHSANKVIDERFVNAEVFRRMRYEEWADSDASGFNLTLGAIYKVTPDFQVGVNMATPTFMRIRRSLYEMASVELVEPDDLPTAGRTHPWDFDYTQIGPFKASLGSTWFLPNQLGFLTASADFVGYKGMKLTHNRERDGAWNDLTGWYRNVVNPKVGAEIRYENLRVRAGFAYFMDPYEGKLIDMKEDRMNVSGGLGYRGNRFFVDATLSYGKQQTAYQLFWGSDVGKVTYNDLSGVLTLGFNF